MYTPVDWTKPIQLRNGDAARFIGSLVRPENSGLYSHIVASKPLGTVYEELIHVYADGRRYRSAEGKTDFDVINVPPPKQKAWTVLHTGMCGATPLSITFTDTSNMDAWILNATTRWNYKVHEIKEWEY